MGFDFAVLPNDLDFKTWKQPLEDQIDKYCGGNMEFRRSSLNWGRGFFSSLSDSESTQRLYNFIRPDSDDGLTPWTNRQWWMIFILVLGLLLFISMIVVAALTSRQKSPKIGLAFKPFFVKRDSASGKPVVNPRSVVPFKWLTCFVAAIVLAFGALTIVTNTQTIVGMNETECNLWLQIYGHYFGGTDMTSQVAAGISKDNWLGTNQLLDQLAALTPQLKPGVDNPIYQDLQNAKVEVLQTATQNTQNTLGLLNKMYDRSNEAAAAFNEISVALASARETSIPLSARFKYAGETVLTYKLYELQARVGGTFQAGAVFIEHVLESYVGQNGILMNKAYQSLVDSKSLIQQVDAAVSRVAHMWTKLSKTLRGAALASASFGIIGSSLSIMAVLWGAWLACGTHKSYSRNNAVARHKTSWILVYSTLIVCGGLFLILLGLNILLAGVGAGVCDMADQRIFTEGRWDLLGDEVLMPLHEETTVDMKAVFDTCIKSSGDGDVISSIGLNARIDELQSDVDTALELLQANRDMLLNKVEMAATMKDFDYLVDFSTTHYLMGRQDYQHRPFRGVFAPQIIPMDKNKEGIILSMLGPKTTTEVPQFGLWEKYKDQGYVVDYVNQFADAVNEYLDELPEPEPETDQDPSAQRRRLAEGDRLPHWCSKLAIALGSSCGEYEDVRMLDEEKIDMESVVVAPCALVAPLEDFVWNDMVPSVVSWDERLRATLHTLLTVESIHLVREWPEEVVIPEILCPSDSTAECSVEDMLKGLRDTIYPSAVDIQDMHKSTEAAFEGYFNGRVIPHLTQVSAIADGLTAGSNCKFHGTVLQHGVVGSLCEVLFPGAAVSALWSLFTCIVTFAAAFTVRYWMHLAEIESDQDPETIVERGQQDQQQVEATGEPETAQS